MLDYRSVVLHPNKTDPTINSGTGQFFNHRIFFPWILQPPRLSSNASAHLKPPKKKELVDFDGWNLHPQNFGEKELACGKKNSKSTFACFEKTCGFIVVYEGIYTPRKLRYPNMMGLRKCTSGFKNGEILGIHSSNFESVPVQENSGQFLVHQW